MGKKYELTEETIELNGHALYRIKALRNFGYVTKGDLGGWIEKEENLSHDGDCWVRENAKVFGSAYVFGNAVVRDNAKVYGNAHVYYNSRVFGDAKVCGDADVYGNAYVYGNAKVYDKAHVYGNAKVFGSANVFGNAVVRDNAKVFGSAYVYDKTKVYGDAKVCGDADVYGNTYVYGNACVFGYADVCSDAQVNNRRDYIVFKNWWSSGRYFTWTMSNNMWKVGCFYGTGQELIDKAYSDSEEKGIEYERIVNYVQDILGEPHLTRTKKEETIIKTEENYGSI